MKQWKTKWQTKDGRVMKIKDMDNHHLLHTIAFLRRKADAIIITNIDEASLAQSNGEMAEMHLRGIEIQWLNTMPDDYLYDECPAFPNMIREAEKRELDTEPVNFAW